MKKHWLVVLYQKNKTTFIVVGLLGVIGYLVNDIRNKNIDLYNKQSEIKQYQKNEQKNNEFLQNWIDRHDNPQTK
jgi:hypothetical protein